MDEFKEWQVSIKLDGSGRPLPTLKVLEHDGTLHQVQGVADFDGTIQEQASELQQELHSRVKVRMNRKAVGLNPDDNTLPDEYSHKEGNK